MVSANDDEWKEMIAEEIRHINADKGMLDEDERFIGGGGGPCAEGGISITAGDDDGETRKGFATSIFMNLQVYRVIHLVVDLGLVEFDLGVPPSCPSAQPLLPNSHQPKQNWADSVTLKIQVNPFQSTSR